MALVFYDDYRPITEVRTKSLTPFVLSSGDRAAFFHIGIVVTTHNITAHTDVFHSIKQINGFGLKSYIYI